MLDYFQILSCSEDLGNCCSDTSLVLALATSRRVISLLQLVAPIVLLIWATIGFIDLMKNPDDDKKNLKKVINKFLAAVVVFLVPIFVEAVLNMLPSSFSIKSCLKQSKVLSENIVNSDLEYVKVSESNKKPIIQNPEDYEKGERKKTPTTGGENKSSSSSSVSVGTSKNVLDGAEKVHTMYENDGWAYFEDTSQLFWNDIEKSTNNPSRMTCCATFVGSALYIGGVFSESEINEYNYNSPYGISELLEAHGWKKITNYNELEPGDIVIMGDHTQIYAGSGTWYNAGSNWSIQNDNPYESDASGRFSYGLRNPS